MAGGVLGFFMGFATGLFADLTIFLHLGAMWDAIQHLPKIIGQVLGDPSILLAMINDLVNGVLAELWPLLASQSSAGRMGHRRQRNT